MDYFKRFRKSGILALIAVVFFVLYFRSQYASVGLNLSSVIFGSLVGPQFFTVIGCFIVGAFTPALISMILFIIAAFTNGIMSLWGIASLILAAIAFFEWRKN